MLRVFVRPSGWHLLGDRFREPLENWLARTGGEFDVDDVRLGRVAPMNARRVSGIDKELPRDIDEWPRDVRFEVGCSHGCGVATVDIKVLAEHCRRAARTKKPVHEEMPG
jgi:hypothetical protein